MSEARARGVRAHGLGKRFGDKWALRHVDLDVPAGTVLGLLGHNGAGKTTAIRILTTLARASEGSAEVAGFDVAADPASVRRSIGVAGQYASVDGLLTARANLELTGRLNHMRPAAVRSRSAELLGRVGLGDEAGDLVKTFSGGMRRRLDLAASLISTPAVLFLDEPTTGLDPQSRTDLWELLREFVREGGTVVLTTQYLDEADTLADDIVVLDHGGVADRGSPAELKRRVGGQRVEVTAPAAAGLEAAARALADFADGSVAVDGGRLIVPVREDASLMDVVRILDAAGVDALDVQRRDPTLDDVFLTLTGRNRGAPGGAPEYEEVA